MRSLKLTICCFLLFWGCCDASADDGSHAMLSSSLCAWAAASHVANVSSMIDIKGLLLFPLPAYPSSVWLKDSKLSRTVSLTSLKNGLVPLSSSTKITLEHKHFLPPSAENYFFPIFLLLSCNSNPAPATSDYYLSLRLTPPYYTAVIGLIVYIHILLSAAIFFFLLVIILPWHILS